MNDPMVPQFDSKRGVQTIRAPKVPIHRLGRRRALAKLSAGRPLLDEEHLQLHVASVLAFAAACIAAQRELGGDAATDLRLLLAQADANIERLVLEAALGHADHRDELLRAIGIVSSDISFALEIAAQPLLVFAALSLRAH